MVWALVLVAAIAIGLPLAAWWLSRDLGPSKQALGGPVPGIPADRWLFDHFQLGVMDRSRVRQAVFAGKALGEPALRRAACGFAADVLRRRRRGAWLARVLGAFNAALGMGCLAVASSALASAQVDALSAVLVIEGVGFVVFGMLMAIAGARQQKQIIDNASNAWQLNRDNTED